jgi:dipeptidyl aminopeptidase/acylaminoacyl peptidase
VLDLAGNPLATIADPALAGPLENTGDFIDSETVLFSSVAGTNRHFFTYDLSTASLAALPLPPGSVDPESWAVSSGWPHPVFRLFFAVTQPPEVFTMPLDGSAPPRHRLPSSTRRWQRLTNDVQVNPVSFATRNGPREGFLVQPAGAPFPPAEEPTVFWQQGGPGFSMVNEFAVEVEMPFNLLPNFGISVLSVPLAGREGFGAELYSLQAEDNNFGQVDIGEGIDIAAQLVGDRWVRRDQLGVTGCSYGGYFAAQAIAQYPNVFAAANPQCSLLDAFTEWQLGYSSLFSYLTGTHPHGSARALSPHFAPVQRGTTSRPPPCSFTARQTFLQVDMARNFHDIIDSNGSPATLYEFEGVGHSIFDTGLQRTAAQLQVDFFRRHLTTPMDDQP